MVPTGALLPDIRNSSRRMPLKLSLTAWSKNTTKSSKHVWPRQSLLGTDKYPTHKSSHMTNLLDV